MKHHGDQISVLAVYDSDSILKAAMTRHFSRLDPEIALAAEPVTARATRTLD